MVFSVLSNSTCAGAAALARFYVRRYCSETHLACANAGAAAYSGYGARDFFISLWRKRANIRLCILRAECARSILAFLLWLRVYVHILAISFIARCTKSGKSVDSIPTLKRTIAAHMMPSFVAGLYRHTDNFN